MPYLLLHNLLFVHVEDVVKLFPRLAEGESVQGLRHVPREGEAAS